MEGGETVVVIYCTRELIFSLKRRKYTFYYTISHVCNIFRERVKNAIMYIGLCSRKSIVGKINELI